MHRVRLPRIVLLLACLALTSAAWGKGSTERTVYSFDEFQAEAVRLAKMEGGPENVLLVMDIDNTLLAMNQDLSSDQWFNWQRALPKNDSRRVGDFDELLRIQRMLVSISTMRPTEPVRQPKIVRELQEAGFTTLILTSRGYEMRDATRRELSANGYDFRKGSLSPTEGFAGPYLPYDAKQIEQSGITRQEAEKWLGDSRNPGQIEDPREVSYNEGVYMVAGQNKGVMLRILLHKSGNVDRYRQIVFVDDNAENTKDVREAFEKQDVNVVALRYSREDANVRRFHEDRNREKAHATLALKSIKLALEAMNLSKSNAPCPAKPQYESSRPQRVAIP